MPTDESEDKAEATSAADHQALPEVKPAGEKSVPAADQPSPWRFSEEISAANAQPTPAHDRSVTWSASEYVAHHKTPLWFLGLGLAVVIIAVGIFFVSHDLISPIMIAILGLVFGVFAARQPHVLEYTVNPHGLAIGPKFYDYDRFKSFSVIDEGPLRSILLTPLQRFMPPISVYYEPTDEDRILTVLADYLPFIEARRDSVDSLMRRVRF